MGANSKQGWCLFVFLVGFAFLPAGLSYLGPLFTLVGLACLVASLIGFYRIKQPAHGPHGLAPAGGAKAKHAM